MFQYKIVEMRPDNLYANRIHNYDVNHISPICDLGLSF